MHFLIVVANFYQDLADDLLKGAVAELEGGDHTYQKISVPGALEVPAAISFAADNDIYDGFIALGCLIKGETINYDIIAAESVRGMNELAMNLNLAIGNGIITAGNKKQAIERANVKKRNKGAFAAKAAIRMAIIRDKFSNMN